MPIPNHQAHSCREGLFVLNQITHFMATELTVAKQQTKDKLILQGCKVVERSWGHLVIMPNMGMALDYFKESMGKSVYNPHLTGDFSEDSKLKYELSNLGVDVMDLSPEYYEKYKKQFERLKTAGGREKTYWIIEDAIHNGDPRKIRQVSELSAKLTDLVFEVNPSLKLDVHRQRAENGDIWDAGLIGADDPRPCWDTVTCQKIKRGSGGDGAYRIIINTDTSFGRSDSENCLVLCAMVNVLQQYADVEIWVQQGWVPTHYVGHKPGENNDDGNGMNGVTLFPAFRGAGLHPAQIMFWAGHPMRDSVFSHLINQRIGRSSGGCSFAAELDCDLYTRNGCFGAMPEFNFNLPDGPKKDANLKELAQWTAGQLSTVLLDESDLGSLGE